VHFQEKGGIVMDLNAVRSFFMWCAIINGALLLLSFLFLANAGDWVYRMHTRWFDMPRETFNTVIYGFVGFFKIIYLMFNLVPYLALVIIG
jgi:hypothetical protein